VQRCRRLAVRSANVRLERVPEAAVTVAVDAQSLDHSIGRGAVEQYGGSVTVQQARIGEDELASGRHVDRHAGDARPP